jgi:hypothetical protein
MTDALGTESVFIGFAICKFNNWNPESTTVPESGNQDMESGILAVGSGIQIPPGQPYMARNFGASEVASILVFIR